MVGFEGVAGGKYNSLEQTAYPIRSGSYRTLSVAGSPMIQHFWDFPSPFVAVTRGNTNTMNFRNGSATTLHLTTRAW